MQSRNLRRRFARAKLMTQKLTFILGALHKSDCLPAALRVGWAVRGGAKVLWAKLQNQTTEDPNQNLERRSERAYVTTNGFLGLKFREGLL